MSGTSLDGVDIAYCTFSRVEGKWNYIIEKATTIPYPIDWKTRLSELETQSALSFVRTDAEYGHYLGQIVREFLVKHNLHPDFIASHGHTIFHQPERKLTSQIGKGSAIAAETGIPVICDFRSTDVALGGQGAPLVPIGDRLLFEKYTYCLNLGGFANISFEEDKIRIAFDVCPANIVLNDFASHFQKEFDEHGDIARIGSLFLPLLEALNKIEFYYNAPPKSLGKEWVIANIHPVLQQFNIPVRDKLRTFVEHIAIQIANVIKDYNQRLKRNDDIPPSSVLITGGGAFNDFLVERIRTLTPIEIVLPDSVTINFKEALIFAFLGVLRWEVKINCLKSCTGASRDNSGGAIYLAIPE
jgi:anhydro-N-acetylmuramic acid kinase